MNNGQYRSVVLVVYDIAEILLKVALKHPKKIIYGAIENIGYCACLEGAV